MQALFNIFEIGDSESQVICARSVANMVLCDQVRSRSIEYGALTILDKGVRLDDKDGSKQCVKAIFVASSTQFRMKISNSSLPLTLLDIAMPKINVERYEYVMRTLCNTAYDIESRVFLQNETFILKLIELMRTNLTDVAAEYFAVVLCVLTYGYPNPQELISAGIVEALAILTETSNTKVVIRAAVNTIRALCEMHEPAIPAMATPEIMAVLKKACIAEEEEPGKPTDGSAMYNIASVLYLFSQDGEKTRSRTAIPDLLDLLLSLRNCPSVSSVHAILLSYFVCSLSSAFYSVSA